MSRRPLTRRVIAALLLVQLTACYSWRPTTVSPQTLIPVEQPSEVRVMLTSQETITLTYPTLRNDSISGVVPYLDGYRRAVAVSDISRLEVRRVSTGRTLALVLPLAGVAAIFIGYLISCGGSYDFC